jgi:hypothetical protein
MSLSIVFLWVRYHCVSEYNNVYYMTSYNVFSNWLMSLVAFFDKKVIFTSCDVIHLPLPVASVNVIFLG